MDLPQRFNYAVDVVRSLPKTGPAEQSNEDKLQFYSLFKQATVGPCNEPKPGFFSTDLVKKYKWEAWNKLGALSKDEAMQRYIDKLLRAVKLIPESAETKEFVRNLSPSDATGPPPEPVRAVMQRRDEFLATSTPARRTATLPTQMPSQIKSSLSQPDFVSNTPPEHAGVRSPAPLEGSELRSPEASERSGLRSPDAGSEHDSEEDVFADSLEAVRPNGMEASDINYLADDDLAASRQCARQVTSDDDDDVVASRQCARQVTSDGVFAGPSDAEFRRIITEMQREINSTICRVQALEATQPQPRRRPALWRALARWVPAAVHHPLFWVIWPVLVNAVCYMLLWRRSRRI